MKDLGSRTQLQLKISIVNLVRVIIWKQPPLQTANQTNYSESTTPLIIIEMEMNRLLLTLVMK